MSAFRIANTNFDATPKRRPVKRADYLSFIRKLPCCISGVRDVEAAHVSFAAPWYGCYGRGKGAKVADRFALPVSSKLHTLQHSGKLGSEKDFWDHHGIIPHELANTLFGIWSDYDEYEAVERAKSRIMAGLADRELLPMREI
ncbi:DUF968 domain-containing protein [Agrobacterium rhizogenes]|nr:DUF968 domain-containing protein [Rhizobium rhizogenes]